MTMTLGEELAWQRKANCRGVNRDLFFPEDFTLPDEAALRLCRRCEVKDECLEYALKHNEVGIWGGMTDEGREKINKTLHRVKCPDCRSQNVMEEGHHEICLNCGLSWPI